MSSGKKAKAERRIQRASIAHVTFWHGGAPGLEAGDTILPRRETEWRSVPTVLPEGYGEYTGRDDRVYVTGDRDLARAYAKRYLSIAGQEDTGVLYRVEPLIPFETDPDYTHVNQNVSVQCKRALVLEVEEAPVGMSVLAARAASGRYATWDTGEPMYGEDGAVNPDPGMRSHGLTSADTRKLWKPWTPFDMSWEADVRAYLEKKSGRG